MALFRRRRNDPYAALSDEERMSRYVHLLTTLPVDVIERAHETAFRRVPRRERREMFDRLRPFMSEQEREAGPTPTLMAGVLRRVSMQSHGATALADRGDNNTYTDGDGGRRRDQDPALPTAAISAMTAQHFLTSAVMVSYFAYGAGAATLDEQPEWSPTSRRRMSGVPGIPGRTAESIPLVTATVGVLVGVLTVGVSGAGSMAETAASPEGCR
ncbi:MAG: hypothetical protein Q7T17_06470 [Microbacterium sp.]|uniref:hypothetical protein n=1 Tax=Microbacterium sp. TaxID=51671 RepID=UPI00271B5436|nr:hypothetical protein [Microbacterium sp.]MDO8382606.1 hypothetical protein [Microbacterium sp.]